MPMNRFCDQEKPSPPVIRTDTFTLTTLLTHPTCAEATNRQPTSNQLRMTTANTLAT